MPDAAGSGPVVFAADRVAFVRGQVLLAVVVALLSAALFLLIGSAYWWLGPVAAFAAVGLRAAMSWRTETGLSWNLDAERIAGSDGDSIALGDVDRVRRLGSGVLVAGRDGDRLVLRHLADPEAVRDAVAAALRPEPDGFPRTMPAVERGEGHG